MNGKAEGLIDLLVRSPTTTTLCSDFDGTLAPLLEDPTLSRAIPGAVELLSRLSALLASVAVISGRPVAFLAERVDRDESHRIELFGRYGAEHQQRDGGISIPAVSAEVRQHLLDIGDEAALDASILVENKAASVSLHWRANPEAKAAIFDIARRHLARGDLEVREGKMVIEFVGKGAPTKGDAVRLLCSAEITACCFLGDDLSDLDAFDALDEFEANGGAAIRIGIDSPEMPPALRDRADLVLDGPSEALQFLAELERRLS